MSLFVLASKDGWVDIMYDGLDAVGVDQQVLTVSEAPFTRIKYYCNSIYMDFYAFGFSVVTLFI